MAGQGDQVDGWFMAVNAAEVGRYANGAADVAA